MSKLKDNNRLGPETANISIDDSVLVRRCRSGDNAAMERLILKYQNRIYNTIMKICANSHDAAELTQETFVKVIDNLSGFKGKSSFYTWLFRIAVNLTLNHCRRNGKLGFRSLDAENGSDDGRTRQSLGDFLRDSTEPNPADLAQSREMYKLIMKALMKLDDDQRAVVVLRDIEDMDYASIANVLDVELGTVKSRLSRARANLRDILEAFL